jgi:hypothetical protein
LYFYICTFTVVHLLLSRIEWEAISKVLGKTLQKLLCTNLPPGILGVKYRLVKQKREYNYALIIACPMAADYWRRNKIILSEFGDGLELIVARTSTFISLKPNIF